MEVKILSTESIKPAPFSVSHHDLKTFPISLLDQVSPKVYTPIIFFYTINDADADADADTDGHYFNEAAIVANLKISLSETLGRFYILAGKINGDVIHCSKDNGALFLQASVNMGMAEFLKRPNLEILSQLFPFPYVSSNSGLQIAVQLNVFADGSGIAIGMSLLHSVIDGVTMSSFIRSWAASCRGVAAGKALCCDYDLISSLFPPREIPDRYALCFRELPCFLSPGERSCTRRFVFDAMAISKLKAKAKSTSVPNPTTVEVVTCFIWKYAMKVTTPKSADNMDLFKPGKEASFVDRKKGSVLFHIVDMRRRINPPLSEASVGNFILRSCSYYDPSNTETKLEDLEYTVRQSLSKIDNDFVRKITGDCGFETFMSLSQQYHQTFKKSLESYVFTSWRNMGLKEVDFGWGKPVWISSGGKAFDSRVKNFVILIETMKNDGIEAWIVLEEQAMKLLECEYEFLEFASLNPSILLG